jgi:hypothetical protein
LWHIYLAFFFNFICSVMVPLYANDRMISHFVTFPRFRMHSNFFFICKDPC